MAKVFFIRPGDTSPWTVPADFNPSNNSVECIGGGSGGGGIFTDGAGHNATNSGNEAGYYAKALNVALTPGGTASFQVGAGGTAGGVGSGGTTNVGGNGGDTWFGSTSTVLAKGGSAVTGSVASGIWTINRPSDKTSLCVGSTIFRGGLGNLSGTSLSGGGAAGPNGAGGTATTTASGAGDNGFGGAAATTAGSAGGAGAEFTQTSDGATAGSGAGGFSAALAGVAGAGGSYGGAGGNAHSGNTTGSGGAGFAGLIVVTYEPGGVAATASQTAAAPVQSAGVGVQVAAASSVAVAAPAQSAHVLIPVHAAQAKTVPAPAQVANGATGRLLRAPTQTAAAVVKVSGTGAQSLRPPAQAATAADPVHAASARPVPAPAQAAALHAAVHAAALQAVPAPSQVAELFVPADAVAAQLMRPPAQVLTGSTGRHLPAPAQVATVHVVASAAAAQAMPAPAQHAAAFVLDNLAAIYEGGNGCGAGLGPFECPTLDQSIEQTLLLLPGGAAWPARDLNNYANFKLWLASLAGRVPKPDEWPVGFVQVGFYAALGAVRNFLETRLCDLRLEFWCATHTETHAEWLAEYGLPDECDPFPDLCAKVAAIGGRRCELYAALAARLGWSIECEANTRCADRALAGRARAGRARSSGSRANLVRIVVHTAASPSFTGRFQTPPRAGRMRAGMRAACPPNIDPLRCLIDRIAPAHVVVEYNVAA